MAMIANLQAAQTQESPQTTKSSDYSPLSFADQCLQDPSLLIPDSTAPLASLAQWEEYLDSLNDQRAALYAENPVVNPELIATLNARGEQKDPATNNPGGRTTDSDAGTDSSSSKPVVECKAACGMSTYDEATNQCDERDKKTKKALQECQLHTRANS
jgi:hypothetical protein